jgi:hypothetical protein
MTTQDMATVCKVGPTIAMGLLELRVPRQNPPARSASHRANIARDKATEKMASCWHSPGPHRGDLASSRFISESRPGGFLHTPLCELASSHPSSLDRDYPGTNHENTWPRFALGGGASAPVWSYGVVLAHASPH